MTSQGFPDQSGLRASDADRDRAAEVVNSALADGRLTADEHADRLDAIYAAKTHGELAPLLGDLPGHPGHGDVTSRAGAAAVRSRRGGRIVAILSGISRKGAWHPEPVINVFTLLGGAELDFREAVLPGSQVTLRAYSVLGGVEVTVPPEMRVIDDGFAFLGGREVTGGDEQVGPDSPVLRIEGFCLLGGIDVTRKARKGDKKGKAPASGPAGMRGSRDGAGLASEHRHDVLRQVREQRREVMRQVREQRRQLRRGWSGDLDD